MLQLAPDREAGAKCLVRRRTMRHQHDLVVLPDGLEPQSVVHPAVGAVDPQLATMRDAQLTGEVVHVIQQLMEHGGLDQLGPADERGVIRHGLGGHPVELAQDQTVAHPVLGLGGVPAGTLRDDHHAQDHLTGVEWRLRGSWVGMTLRQIGGDPLDIEVVIEQAVEFPQLGRDVGGPFRDQLKEVEHGVPIDPHGGEASHDANGLLHSYLSAGGSLTFRTRNSG